MATCSNGVMDETGTSEVCRVWKAVGTNQFLALTIFENLYQKLNSKLMQKVYLHARPKDNLYVIQNSTIDSCYIPFNLTSTN